MSQYLQTKNSARKRGGLLVFIIFHRWVGISTFILLLSLAITGIMLNHTEELKLNQSYIKNTWLQNWYGIKMPQQQNFIKLDNTLIAQIGKKLYLNQSHLLDEKSPLIGSYKSNDFIIIAMKKALYLFTLEGDLIERLDSEKNLPSPISRIGFSELIQNSNQLMIEVNQQYYTSNDDFLSWTKIQSKEFYPLELEDPKNVDKTFYQNAYLGNELNLERVILDLHSGRLLGRFGVYLMDLAAIILIMLGLSGTWIWSRRFRK